MADRRDPNGQIDAIHEYRRNQTGWRVDSSERGPKFDFRRQVGDPFWNATITAAETIAHPLAALRDSSRGTKITLGAIATTLAVGAGANYVSHTPRVETPQGVEELNEIGKNVDGREGVEAWRVNKYLEEMPGVFSEQGKQQLYRASLQVGDEPMPWEGTREDFENTQRGLDAMIVVEQIIEGHDLGNGRFLEFDETALRQIDERLGDFVKSGLASDEIRALHESGNTLGTVSYLRDLAQNRATAHAVLDGKTVENLGNPGQNPGMTLGG